MLASSIRSMYRPSTSFQLLKKSCGILSLGLRKSRRTIGAVYGINTIENVQCYLSPAYICQEKWDNRLKDPFIKDVKPLEYYYELLRKYKKEGRISAIDADIFLNSVSEKTVGELADEMEEVLSLLRRSPETNNTLYSTPHAVIKCYLEAKQYNLILKLISDPINYGVFLDCYTAELLMDTFIKENNYMAAARVASTLMLQEDFGTSLTKSLVLMSCLKYVFNAEENKEWVDFNPVVEPEEEVKILVRYIRNPYFDDHFDLKDPSHIVGKTLAWLSLDFEDFVLKRNAEVLGWSLYQKWDQLILSLDSMSKNKQEIAMDVFTKISVLVDECQDEALKPKISSLISQMKSSNLVSNLNAIDKAEEYLVECIKKYENENIKNQENVYDDCLIKRKEAVAKQLELYERNQLIKEIEEKKDDLQRREDVIFFFDNKNKFDLLTPIKRKYYPKKRSQYFHKKKPRAVDEAYVPPEV